jgi:hypothetical protein
MNITTPASQSARAAAPTTRHARDGANASVALPSTTISSSAKFVHSSMFIVDIGSSTESSQTARSVE